MSNSIAMLRPSRVGQKLRLGWAYLTAPAGFMEEEQRGEAHILASVLMSMLLLGILVSVLDIATSPPEERIGEVYAGFMTLAVLIPAYLLARTPLYRFAVLVATVAYDFMAVLGYLLIPQPFFLGYFLIPILLSALFSTRRTVLFVTSINLAMAFVLATQITGQSFMEVLQAGMLPVLFNTVLILTWSHFSREDRRKESSRLQLQQQAVLQKYASLEEELSGQIAALSEENLALRQKLASGLPNIDLLANGFETQSPSVQDSPLETLTPREQELLQLMVDGLNNDEIAGSLCITVQTVRNHARNIYRKLEASTRVEAVLMALHWGMSPSPDSITIGKS